MAIADGGDNDAISTLQIAAFVQSEGKCENVDVAASPCPSHPENLQTGMVGHVNLIYLIHLI
jgi:hypothetical protein